MNKLPWLVLGAALAVVQGCNCNSGPVGTNDGGDVRTITMSGSVTGLKGSGLVLQDNVGHELAISGNGPFAFPEPYPAGSDVLITVKQQPTAPPQTCTVTGGDHRQLNNDVTTVSVTCADNAYTISGTVTGLEGTGLVLQNNDGDDLAVSANGPFTFATPVEAGQTFTVSVKTQPTSPTQTCVVMGGSGTVANENVSSVAVNCSTNTYTIAGTVSGLEGTGLVLTNNGGDDLAVTANGTFAFATPLPSGAAFSVQVKTHPSSPTQLCTVTSGSGTVVSSNVTTVVVECATQSYAVGGTVSGLVGSGLVLQNNLGDSLPVTQDGAFVFTMPVASGAPYSVSVLTQPTSPSQSCIVSNGSGTLASSAITDVTITCTTNSYVVGGTVSGLAGSGLVLQNNGGDDLAVTADGTFTFATPVASGATFDVTVATQPSSPTQTCTVVGGTGTVGGADISSIAVNCTTNEYLVGGTVAGLSGSGLALTLNGGAPLAISANGSFAFPTPLPSGSTYAVAISAQPTNPWQTCALSGSGGTVTSSDVTSVAVTCVTNQYAVGGSVSGLAGSGLVLQNNLGDDLAVAADGTFMFATSITSGQPYAVTVKTQPTSPWQTCTVAQAAGTVGGADITNVQVTCTTNTYTVGGTISGLAGTVVLHNNGGDSLTLNANGPFTFPTALPSGASYVVTVATQPSAPSQTCTVTSGAGTVSNSNVSSVAVTCVTNTYSIGGTVSGLSGAGLVLQNKLGDNLSITQNGTFTFPTKIASGQTYSVTVLTQPTSPSQTCTVTGGSGTVGASNVTSVAINCTTNQYTVGGTVTGLSGTGLILTLNGGNDLAVSGAGSFAFPTPVNSGSTYTVAVKANPTSPWQTCNVTSGATGTVGSSNVTSVQVSCVTNNYPISVTVSGLAGSGLVLQNNGGDNRPVPANGTFFFNTPVASGQTYNVTVLTQPTTPWQTCTVASPTGTVGGSGVNLSVSCATNTYNVGGTVSGLTGSGLVLKNGSDTLSISSNGTFTFPTKVASGVTYAVTVQNPPSGQSCTVSNGSGTVQGANVTNVGVSCVAAMYKWVLIEPHACNAWCGQGPVPFNTCTGPFVCDAAHVGGTIWSYGGNTTSASPPPNPAPQGNFYGWNNWYCGSNGCGGPGPNSGNCTSNGTEQYTIWQCVLN